tara:strand:- start:586 stop:1068 length:483 start_codon:yes stop_codon:yes gene_type:complete
MKLGKHEVKGITSRTEDNQHILLMDYDDPFELKWIESEIIFLQKTFNLGDFYIFRSNKGHHVICLDKVLYSDMLNILRHTSMDINHLFIPNKMGAKLMTLRVTEKEDGQKPQYLGIVHSINTGREKSKVHATFLKNIYDINLPMTNMDESRTMIGAKYKI